MSSIQFVVDPPVGIPVASSAQFIVGDSSSSEYKTVYVVPDIPSLHHVNLIVMYEIGTDFSENCIINVLYLGRRKNMRPHGSPKQLQERRERAIELLKQGNRPVDVARMLGVQRRSIRRWKAVYKTKGIRGIEAKEAEGRPPKLNIKQKKHFEKVLLKGAKVEGFDTNLWTCPRVTQIIKKHFGVKYNVDHVGRLLHSMGWSPQRPQRKAMERNEREIRRWENQR